MLVNLTKIQKMKQRIIIKKTLEKGKKIAMTFEDPNKVGIHDNYENDKHEKNLHILKVITEAVLS